MDLEGIYGRPSKPPERLERQLVRLVAASVGDVP
jgi:hypothetical protein